MTPAQQARVRGFNVNLAQRGVTYTTPSGQTFQGLTQFQDPALDDFELGPAQRNSRVIHVLRDTFQTLNGVDEKTRLVDKEGNAAWIVAWVQDDPIQIAVMLHCNKESQ